MSKYIILQVCYNLGSSVKAKKEACIRLIWENSIKFLQDCYDSNIRELNRELFTELSALYTLDWWSMLYYY